MIYSSLSPSCRIFSFSTIFHHPLLALRLFGAGVILRQALTNIRLSCCGGGTLIPVVKRHHHVETIDMLRDLHAVGDIDLRRVDNFINRATTGEVSSCQVSTFYFFSRCAVMLAVASLALSVAIVVTVVCFCGFLRRARSCVHFPRAATVYTFNLREKSTREKIAQSPAHGNTMSPPKQMPCVLVLHGHTRRGCVPVAMVKQCSL